MARARRTGRRPGAPDTREEILAAARAEFGDQGYRAATVRGIARRADVDPALIHHYFGTKPRLFAATLDLPLDPAEMAEQVLGGGLEGGGERLIRTVLEVWESDAVHNPLQAVLRSIAAGGETSEMVREFVTDRIIGTVAGLVSAEDGALRAELVASQLLGLGLVRYVLRLEPLASADTEVVVAAYAPTLQRYMTGDLRPDERVGSSGGVTRGPLPGA